MVRMCPALSKRVKILDSQKRLIYQPTGSIYQVLSADVGNKHGFNTHGVVFDELHTQPNRKLFDVMTKGSGDARMQPLYFLITTAGNDTKSICYEIHQKAKDIIEGRKIDHTFYPVIYGAEESDDWTDPKVWKKANPSLGITVGIDKVKDACESAKQNPGEENSFRQLRLNQWVKSSMITTISEVQSTVDKVESTVGRFPKLLQTAIGKATGLITGQSGGYVVINTDSESGQPYELLILDAPSIDEAVNVWRWNVGGLGFSHNGYNGPYETAITADGQIVADFVTSGSLVANIIKAGVIQSQDGSSYWDLESGEVVLRAYATSKEVTEVSDRITTIEEQKMLRLVIISSNGNIFKNGNVKTLLSAKVYSWDEDITDTLDANQFVWTRVSEDTEADKVWNEQHFGGAKSVVITGADVKIRATFYCDLIDTTTRQSLL